MAHLEDADLAQRRLADLLVLVRLLKLLDGNDLARLLVPCLEDDAVGAARGERACRWSEETPRLRFALDRRWGRPVGGGSAGRSAEAAQTQPMSTRRRCRQAVARELTPRQSSQGSRNSPWAPELPARLAPGAPSAYCDLTAALLGQGAGNAQWLVNWCWEESTSCVTPIRRLWPHDRGAAAGPTTSAE